MPLFKLGFVLFSSLAIFMNAGALYGFGEEDESYKDLLNQIDRKNTDEKKKEPSKKDESARAAKDPELEQVLKLYEASIGTDVLEAGRYLSLYTEFVGESLDVDEKKEDLARRFKEFIKKEEASSPIFMIVSEECAAGYTDYMNNNYADARKHFEKVKIKLPNYTGILTYISQADAKDKEMKKLRARIENSLKGITVAAAAEEEAAGEADKTEAMTAFEKASRYILEGNRLLQEEKPVDALQKFMEAKKHDPANPEIPLYIKTASSMLKKQKEARAAEEKTDLKSALAKYQEAQLEDPENKEAVEKIEELTLKLEDANKSNELEGYIKKARDSYDRGDVQTAVKHIKKAFEIAPKYSKVLELAALIQEKKNQLEDSDYLRQQANEHKQTGLELKNKKDKTEKDFQKAINEFQKAMDILPEGYPDRKKLQDLVSETKKELVAWRAKNVDKDAVQKTFKEGVDLWLKGKRQEAKEKFQKCIDLDPDITLDATKKARDYLKK